MDLAVKECSCTLEASCDDIVDDFSLNVSSSCCLWVV